MPLQVTSRRVAAIGSLVGPSGELAFAETQNEPPEGFVAILMAKT